ncbi:MAG: restriction endonuclease subunit S [Gallionella sp.]|nr:MAG: restriction endonuclease subunit S [Gallionella sp.]
MGGWETKRLADVCEKIMDGTHFSPKSKSGSHMYLTSQNIQNGIIELSNISYISEEEHRQIYDKCPVKKNDVLLTKDGANTGNCAINNIGYEFSLLSSVAVLRGNKLSLNHIFLYQTILTDNIQRIIRESMSGQAITRITLEKIGNFLISITSIEEQQKIADCLSSIDELLTLETQKLATLKSHKKGLMQQLFPAEGETVPKLRFPEFRNAPEWEEKQLGEISDIKTGPFGSVLHESDYVEIGTPIITVEHLGELGIIGNNAPKVSYSDKIRLKAYQLKEGDIIFSRVGSVDRCAITGKTENGWLFSGRILRLRIINSENLSCFIKHLLKYEPSKVKIRDSAVGQTMPSLNTEILKKISLCLPLFPEQQKIADCLSAVDELITAQTQKLDTLKTHKKGLMQQLFPAADEVMG